MEKQAKLSAIANALEHAWSDIQQKHSDVRDAVIVVYRHAKGDRRGHFAQDSWTVVGQSLDDNPEQGAIDEVHISSHILGQGARSVLETLIHEAAHSVATARGIKDVSRQNRWHNRRFSKLADELGLVVERDERIGHVTPDITGETTERYKATLMWLEDQLGDLYQMPPVKIGQTRKANTTKLVCPTCGRYFRIGNKQLDLGEVICEPCGVAFEPEDE